MAGGLRAQGFQLIHRLDENVKKGRLVVLFSNRYSLLSVPQTAFFSCWFLIE